MKHQKKEWDATKQNPKGLYDDAWLDGFLGRRRGRPECVRRSGRITGSDAVPFLVYTIKSHRTSILLKLETCEVYKTSSWY
jgi:hypothetical protein